MAIVLLDTSVIVDAVDGKRGRRDHMSGYAPGKSAPRAGELKNEWLKKGHHCSA
jgi:hypothetical protein